MNQYKNARFIHLFLRFSIIFFVIVTILKLGMGFFRFNGIEGMKNEYLIDDKWQHFFWRKYRGFARKSKPAEVQNSILI